MANNWKYWLNGQPREWVAGDTLPVSVEWQRTAFLNQFVDAINERAMALDSFLGDISIQSSFWRTWPKRYFSGIAGEYLLPLAPGDDVQTASFWNALIDAAFDVGVFYRGAEFDGGTHRSMWHQRVFVDGENIETDNLGLLVTPRLNPVVRGDRLAVCEILTGLRDYLSATQFAYVEHDVIATQSGYDYNTGADPWKWNEFSEQVGLAFPGRAEAGSIDGYGNIQNFGIVTFSDSVRREFAYVPQNTEWSSLLYMATFLFPNEQPYVFPGQNYSLIQLADYGWLKYNRTASGVGPGIATYGAFNPGGVSGIVSSGVANFAFPVCLAKMQFQYE